MTKQTRKPLNLLTFSSQRDVKGVINEIENVRSSDWGLTLRMKGDVGETNYALDTTLTNNSLSWFVITCVDNETQEAVLEALRDEFTSSVIFEANMKEVS